MYVGNVPIQPQGCYLDSDIALKRDLDFYASNLTYVTPEWCMKECKDKDFLYSGTQVSNLDPWVVHAIPWLDDGWYKWP